MSQSSPKTLNHMEDGEQNTGRVEKRDGVRLLLPLFLPSLRNLFAFRSRNCNSFFCACNKILDKIILIELGGRPHNRCVIELRAATAAAITTPALMLCKLLLSLAAGFQLS